MKVIEFTVHTTTEGSELVADVLWQHTTGGVAILDAADAIVLQKGKRVSWDRIGESAVRDTGEAFVKCCFSAETAEDERAVRAIGRRPPQSAAGAVWLEGELFYSVQQMERKKIYLN